MTLWLGLLAVGIYALIGVLWITNIESRLSDSDAPRSVLLAIWETASAIILWPIAGPAAEAILRWKVKP